MKKKSIIKGALFMFAAVLFFSCENEPLTGTFLDPSEQNPAAEGDFIANVAGSSFIADSTSVILYSDNKMEISGMKENGEEISLLVSNAAHGTFNLGWNGEGYNKGIYNDGQANSTPYITLIDGGGSGQLMIYEIDTIAKTITGTFKFVGVRMKTNENGMPVLDGNGMPILENIDIKNGAFNKIPYIREQGDGDGDGDGEEPTPQHEFFAKANGQDFIADTITVTEPINGNVPMLVIKAENADHEIIRIDIPKSLGIGNYDMEQLSDGTKLIGVFKDTDGNNLTSNPGTLRITEFDLIEGVLKATFQFKATDPMAQTNKIVNIREGNMTIYFEGVPGAYNRFKAEIDGITYEADSLDITTSVVNRYPRIEVVTTYRNQKLILKFPATITEGTFEMGPEVEVGNEVVGVYYPVNGVSIPYNSESGELTITNYDHEQGTIEGTFSFTATDTSGQDPTVYEVTAGDFFIILE